MNFSLNKIVGVLARLQRRGIIILCSLCSLCSFVLLSEGCSESGLRPVPQDGTTGGISLGIAFDSKTLEEKPTKTEGTKADVDYKVTIRDAENRRIRLWSSAAQVPQQIWLLSGNYKVEVEAGTDAVAAFDSPYYTGSQDISIEPETVLQQEVVCRLANAKVTVKYSDKIKNNFATYRTKVGPTGKLLTFDTESKVGFYKTPGGEQATELTWDLAIANSAGNTFTESGTFKVEPRKHYVLEVDLESTGASEGGLTFLTHVTVNEDAVLVEDEIKVPIKRLPEITGVGYDIATDYFIQYGNHPDVKVNLRGTPKIDSVGFAHDCAWFTTKGIPVDFDLFGSGAIGESAKNQLNGLGLVWTMAEDGVTMEVSFTELIKNLPEGTYHFEFGVKDTSGKRASKTLTLLIMDSDVVTVGVTDAALDVWPGRARFRGRWTSSGNPGGLVFEYQKTTDGNNWTRVSDGIVVDNAGTGDFSVLVTGLEPGTAYNYRAVANDFPGNSQTLTTEAGMIIPNLNFDAWYQDSKPWFAASEADYKAGTYWFDSGNKGTTTSVLNVNPTQGDATDVHTPGGKAAKMVSQWAGMFGIGKFAAGNIYTGRFGSANTSNYTATLHFGRPFTSRPTRLRGWYKYNPVAIGSYVETNPGGLVSGDMDRANIYVALCDWSGPHLLNTADIGTFPDWSESNSTIIAFGELVITENTGTYVYFELDIEYRDLTRRPKYIVLAASASMYGNYFTGGEGTTLWIDDFELIYD